jgi:hypothetical protein
MTQVINYHPCQNLSRDLFIINTSDHVKKCSLCNEDIQPLKETTN